ncbi:hypothetical protein [Jeotgalibacillus haloalkalitolerans]|uniref:Uncharacterized protein n=1 Tax=Jeotgalibacillus haloalkalitolerans TaxID=3104292 RepID=A0ABU5KID1_9BACL|nr:hypothetical protein [Jeotgalibacillus sp. HH7-29]MDZ5711004.1 hypothetical protein [Jeotgalibacillus sp. HH7-29]
MAKILKLITILTMFTIVIYIGGFEIDQLNVFAALMFFLSLILAASFRNPIRSNIFFIISLSCLSVIVLTNLDFLIGAISLVTMILWQFFYCFYYVEYEREKLES